MSTSNPINSTESNRSIAKSIAKFFGGDASVNKYVSDDGSSSTFILSCADSPQTGVTSYSTVGLSDNQFKVTENEIPLGVEVIGTCGKSFELFPNIISSVYLKVLNERQECFPGAIFKDVVAINEASETLHHILLVDPFLWPVSPETMHFDSKVVAWLQAVPISQSELQFSEEYGQEALHNLFEENQIDIFDLNRKPACP